MCWQRNWRTGSVLAEDGPEVLWLDECMLWRYGLSKGDRGSTGEWMHFRR